MKLIMKHLIKSSENVTVYIEYCEYKIIGIQCSEIDVSLIFVRKRRDKKNEKLKS